VVKAVVVLRDRDRSGTRTSPGEEPGSGKPQTDDSLVAELQQHCREATAPYKYPRLIEFVDELPKTASGKIKRAELRGRESGSAPGV
jgi:acyl-coenzyme A synthetase/AMP-(fatty) acid ligase